MDLTHPPGIHGPPEMTSASGSAENVDVQHGPVTSARMLEMM